MILKAILVFLTLISFLSMFLTERPIYFAAPFWTLLWALSYFDIRTMKLPNVLTASVLLLGILYNVYLGQDWMIPVASVSIAATVLILITFGYLKLRRRQGLGIGDIKLFAAGAVWLNPYLLPVVLLFSSLGAILYVFIPKAGEFGSNLNRKIPYGPFLALAIWITWIFENNLLAFLL